MPEKYCEGLNYSVHNLKESFSLSSYGMLNLDKM